MIRYGNLRNRYSHYYYFSSLSKRIIKNSSFAAETIFHLFLHFVNHSLPLRLLLYTRGKNQLQKVGRVGKGIPTRPTAFANTPLFKVYIQLLVLQRRNISTARVEHLSQDEKARTGVPTLHRSGSLFIDIQLRD